MITEASPWPQHIALDERVRNAKYLVVSDILCTTDISRNRRTYEENVFGALVTCVRESQWFLWLKRRIWLSLHQVAIPVLKLPRLRLVRNFPTWRFPSKSFSGGFHERCRDDFRTTKGSQHFSVIRNIFEGRDRFRTKKTTSTIFFCLDSRQKNMKPEKASLHTAVKRCLHIFWCLTSKARKHKMCFIRRSRAS